MSFLHTFEGRRTGPIIAQHNVGSNTNTKTLALNDIMKAGPKIAVLISTKVWFECEF